MHPVRMLATALALSGMALITSSLRAAADFESVAAPSWQLKDVNGRAISSDQFKGKVVVVDFWATWCGPCRSEIPGYVALQQKYAKAGLAIVGVSLDQGGAGVVKKFMADEKITYQVVMGDDRVVDAFGGVAAVPTTFVIDRNGIIRFRKVGAMPAGEFEAVLQRFLK
ncbi:MAG: TlpA disulfide reductase family protein [Opitutaceae bacterium]|nr:TlpA disulfide reductase family protein [Opitutaceae bacterium]